MFLPVKDVLVVDMKQSVSWEKIMIQKIKNIILYFLDSIENIYYEEVMNDYGLKHATKKQVMKYVKKMKEKMK